MLCGHPMVRVANSKKINMIFITLTTMCVGIEFLYNVLSATVNTIVTN